MVKQHLACYGIKFGWRSSMYIAHILTFLAIRSRRYYPGQKNRYSRDIHERDRQCDHVISCDIDFDLQRELATRRYRESHQCRTEARYRTISHDRTADQPHEFLGCNDFFGQGSSYHPLLLPALYQNVEYCLCCYERQLQKNQTASAPLVKLQSVFFSQFFKVENNSLELTRIFRIYLLTQ